MLQTTAGVVLFVRRQDPRGQYEHHSYHCQSLLRPSKDSDGYCWTIAKEPIGEEVHTCCV